VVELSDAAAAWRRSPSPGRLVGDLHDRSVVTQHLTEIAALGRALELSRSAEAVIVVGHHQAALAAEVNRYLRAHPADHDDVLEEIRRLAIRDFPYDALNEGRATSLAVSFCFPPVVDTSGMVMAKRIAQHGEIVDVISNNANTARVSFDEGAERIAEEYVAGHTTVKATRVLTKSWPAIAEFVEQGVAAAAAREAEHGPYRRVRSRAMWIAAHALAGLLRARQADLWWSAEMSDPLSRDVRGDLREAPLPHGDPLTIELRGAARRRGFALPPCDHIGVFVELMTYAIADEVVFTNELQRDYMLGYCEVPALAARARSVAVVRAQPMLERRFYDLDVPQLALWPDRVNLAYFGNLYANRSLDDVVGALAALSPDERDRVRLWVFTSTPSFMEEHVAAAGLNDLVTVREYLPYLQFLGALRQFDCVLIEDAWTAAGGHNINPYLPSKWADYRGSRTPVWGIVEAGSPLSREGLAYRSPRGDRVAATETLRRIIDERARQSTEQIDAGSTAPK
jgi:hypothetical protein